jgi:HK97 gp10 family phage protein
MLADPAVLYAVSARRRCVDIAEQIVHHIQTSPVTPERTHALEMGYRAIARGTGAEVVTNVRYWAYVEFGTEDTRAQPHVRPAVEAVRARNT